MVGVERLGVTKVGRGVEARTGGQVGERGAVDERELDNFIAVRFEEFCDTAGDESAGGVPAQAIRTGGLSFLRNIRNVLTEPS